MPFGREQSSIDIILGGWSPITDTWTYNSTDNPTGIINWTGANSKVSAGMRIRFNNGGNTIYGIVTAVTGSIMTFLHEMNEANNNAVNLMANSAITNAFVSAYKAPLGFPLNPDKWSVITKDSTNRDTTSTDYVSLTTSLVVPIGVWKISHKSGLRALTSLVGGISAFVSLSSGGATETNPDLTVVMTRAFDGGLSHTGSTMYAEQFVGTTAKTTYTLIGKVTNSAVTLLLAGSSFTPTIINATCAYL